MLCDEFLSGGFTDNTLDAVGSTSKDKDDKNLRAVQPLRVLTGICRTLHEVSHTE